MIDTKLERHQATSDLGVTSRTRIFALCDELDETREKLNDVKQAYAALDQNWCNIHNAMGDAVRRALGLPDATVPEIVAAIRVLRAKLKVAEEERDEGAGGCPCDECVDAEVET